MYTLLALQSLPGIERIQTQDGVVDIRGEDGKGNWQDRVGAYRVLAPPPQTPSSEGILTEPLVSNKEGKELTRWGYN